MTALVWLQAHAALATCACVALVNACTRLAASGAWADESKLHPTAALVVRVVAALGPDLIGGVRELLAPVKAPVIAPAPPANDVEKGPADAA